MSTLLLRLSSPMQSWGCTSKFDRRLTEKEPTKSGIIGMLACAMGIGREDSLELFDNISYGVRIDQIGKMLKDFQTAREQKESKKVSSWVTSRYYLCDAIFLVGIEDKLDILQEIEYCLKHPLFPIYLGRRSCPPAFPLLIGIRQTNLREALREEPWIASKWYKKLLKRQKVASLDIVRDAVENEKDTYSMRDVPISFSQKKRLYTFRNIIREKVPLKSCWYDSDIKKEEIISTDHNPMTLWEENDVSDKS